MLGAIHKALGTRGFYPIPSWLRSFMARMEPSRAILTYARLMDGVDLSFTVPDDVGCAESVTRICNALYGDEIIPGTYTLLHHYLRSNKWAESFAPVNGCVVIAPTGTGNGSMPGHVGIYDNGKVWSNNSMSGRFDAHFTMSSFYRRYTRDGGIRVRCFIRVNK